MEYKNKINIEAILDFEMNLTLLAINFMIPLVKLNNYKSCLIHF